MRLTQLVSDTSINYTIVVTVTNWKPRSRNSRDACGAGAVLIPSIIALESVRVREDNVMSSGISG